MRRAARSLQRGRIAANISYPTSCFLRAVDLYLWNSDPPLRSGIERALHFAPSGKFFLTRCTFWFSKLTAGRFGFLFGGVASRSVSFSWAKRPSQLYRNSADRCSVNIPLSVLRGQYRIMGGGGSGAVDIAACVFTAEIHILRIRRLKRHYFKDTAELY